MIWSVEKPPAFQNELLEIMEAGCKSECVTPPRRASQASSGNRRTLTSCSISSTKHSWLPTKSQPVRAISAPRRQTARLRCRFSTASIRYLASRTGDVKKLKPPFTGFRLRCGDFRVFFDFKDDNAIEITAVRNRKEAYR